MTPRLGSVVLRSIAAWDALPDRLRPPLLRKAGVLVGQQVQLTSGTRFAKFSTISIADSTYLNHDCYFDAEADITIGARCSIADHVRFITATHEVGPESSRAGTHSGRAIVVGPGTWIGSSVLVLPGVTIGSGCIIAAGAVVNRDCEPNSLYGGVPAKKLRDL